MKINGVLGPIDTAELGFTLPHEHITCADWSMRMNFGEKFYDEDTVVKMAAAQLIRAREHGVRTVVDGTPVNLGRDVKLLRRVAAETGMNLIASSGFYYQEEPWLAMRDEEEIYDLLLGECRDGISGTDTRPGILKSGVSSAGLTPLMTKLLRATGRTAAETGLPIFCHHDPAAGTGPAILDLYASAGVEPHRVILGHSGDTNDLDYLERIAKRGCYLGFDRLAYGDRDNSTENNVRNIVALTDRGYGAQILLSHDFATYLAFWDSWESAKQADYAHLKADFSFVSRVVLPMLRKYSVSEEQIDGYTTGNPRAFFEGSRKFV